MLAVSLYWLAINIKGTLWYFKVGDQVGVAVMAIVLALIPVIIAAVCVYQNFRTR